MGPLLSSILLGIVGAGVMEDREKDRGTIPSMIIDLYKAAKSDPNKTLQLMTNIQSQAKSIERHAPRELHGVVIPLLSQMLSIEDEFLMQQRAFFESVLTIFIKEEFQRNQRSHKIGPSNSIRVANLAIYAKP